MLDNPKGTNTHGCKEKIWKKVRQEIMAKCCQQSHNNSCNSNNAIYSLKSVKESKEDANCSFSVKMYMKAESQR